MNELRLPKEIKISIDIESIVKVRCVNTKCPNHLVKFGYVGCNLKNITINQQGECVQGKVGEK